MEPIVKKLEGTWEEIREHDAELKGKRVSLRVVDGDAAESSSEPNSTLGSLLKHAGGWSGDDFEECLQAVYDNRTEARF